MKKLYVGNLPYEVTESEISDAFKAYGETTSVKLISDRDTGRGRGFGFVEMENAEQAQEVLNNLNGKELFGRTLKIDIAKERPRNSPRPGAGYNRGARHDGYRNEERSFNR